MGHPMDNTTEHPVGCTMRHYPMEIIYDRQPHGLRHGQPHGLTHDLAHGLAHGLTHGLVHGIAHGQPHGVCHVLGQGIAVRKMFWKYVASGFKKSGLRNNVSIEKIGLV